MYTVYDFINNDISSKHMRCGWRIEVDKRVIILRYTMLNFDWKSLEFLNDELFNMFLNSKSYKNLRQRLDNAKKKLKRLYLDAYDISTLKFFANEANIKVDIDKLIEKTITKKSKKIT